MTWAVEKFTCRSQVGMSLSSALEEVEGSILQRVNGPGAEPSLDFAWGRRLTVSKVR